VDKAITRQGDIFAIASCLTRRDLKAMGAVFARRQLPVKIGHDVDGLLDPAGVEIAEGAVAAPAAVACQAQGGELLDAVVGQPAGVDEAAAVGVDQPEDEVNGGLGSAMSSAWARWMIGTSFFRQGGSRCFCLARMASVARG
jgi:hypothetical protein